MERLTWRRMADQSIIEMKGVWARKGKWNAGREGGRERDRPFTFHGCWSISIPIHDSLANRFREALDLILGTCDHLAVFYVFVFLWIVVSFTSICQTGPQSVLTKIWSSWRILLDFTIRGTSVKDFLTWQLIDKEFFNQLRYWRLDEPTGAFVLADVGDPPIKRITLTWKNTCRCILLPPFVAHGKTAGAAGAAALIGRVWNPRL